MEIQITAGETIINAGETIINAGELTAERTRGRIISIDRFRGLAVFTMF